MELLLINLDYIFAAPALIATFLGSGFLGMSCLVAALGLTTKKDLKTRWLKYLLTTCCISFISGFFIMLMVPAMFAEISSCLLVTKSFIFIIIWVALAEISHYFFKSKEDDRRDKIYQRQ